MTETEYTLFILLHGLEVILICLCMARVWHAFYKDSKLRNEIVLGLYERLKYLEDAPSRKLKGALDELHKAVEEKKDEG